MLHKLNKRILIYETAMNVKLFMIIFVLAATILLLLGHAGLYFSWVNFFAITAVKAKIIFAIVMGLLAISFIATSALIFWKDGAFLNALYTGASAWIGFAWYATLATGLSWIIILVFRFQSRPLPLQLVIGALLLIAVGYASYGIWNAQHPIRKEITVTITGIPDAWKNKKIVQLSDIHLGPINRQKFLEKIIAQTNQEDPFIVFITGDLFDGAGSDLDDLVEPLKKLISEKGTYFITGNHETYIGSEKSLQALHNIHLTVLRDERIIINGMQILGVDYPEAGQKKDVSGVVGQLDSALPSIILYHEPTHIEEFEKAGGDFMLSGHTHKGQMWPFNWITHSIFKGYDYGLKKINDMQVYTSPGIGTWGPPMRTGSHPEIVVITLN